MSLIRHVALSCWATNILNFMQPPLFVTPLRLEPCVCVYVQLGTFCIIFLISRWNMTKDTHTNYSEKCLPAT